MIKINLAPLDENEDRYWMLPDLAALATGVLVVFLVTGFFLEKVRSEITVTQAEITNSKTAQDGMRDDLRAYDAVTAQIVKLKNRRQSIVAITESKISRYLPIILMEHLQNLKPEGVWFSEVKFTKKDELYGASSAATNRPAPPPDLPGGRDPINDMMIAIKGRALNTAILAEFLTAIKATRHQEYEATDMRSHAYFAKMGMTRQENRPYLSPFEQDLAGRAATSRVPEMEIPEFDIWLHFAARGPSDVPTIPGTPAKPSVSKKGQGGGSHKKRIF